MILSISRRTDIPAFYSDWLYNRVREGFVYVRNPMNIHQISLIPINVDIVDFIVFWTKNPEKMLDRISELRDYNYYFQFSVNPYGNNIEKSVPKKLKIFDTFKRLSDLIGPEKVIWRYDPILISNEIDIRYHIKYFETISNVLRDYSKTCVISFIDNYKKTERNVEEILARELNSIEIQEIAKQIAEISKVNNFTIQTCAEKYDLDLYGIKHGRCIDDDLIERILGEKLFVGKDKNQRKECGCIESIDIGEYNTCNHGCVYCYANFNKQTVLNKISKHNPNSPLLIGDVQSNDVIINRKVNSFIDKNTLFKI